MSTHSPTPFITGLSWFVSLAAFACSSHMSVEQSIAARPVQPAPSDTPLVRPEAKIVEEAIRKVPMQPAQPQPPASTTTAATTLEGTWQVSYKDAQLGEISGQAIIKRGETEGVVKYAIPSERPGDFDHTFELQISEIKREGAKVTMTLTGESPSGPRVLPPDLKGIKQLPVPQGAEGAPPPQGQVTAKDLRKSVPIQTVLQPEVNVAHLEMNLSPMGDMSGQWFYRCDPITERDLRGFGRVGTFELIEGEALSGKQRGPERWMRKRPVIELAIVVQDQYKIESYGPVWPWPFAPGHKSNATENGRKLLLIGKDLPKRGEPAVFEVLSSGILGYWHNFSGDEVLNDAMKRDDLNWAWKRADAMLAANGQKIDHSKVEVALVSTSFDKTVKPGRQAFTLNGAPAIWVLGFGDLQGELRFARPMSEDVPGTTSADVTTAGESEPLSHVILREYVQIECTVDTTVESLGSITVNVTRNGEPVKVGGRADVVLTRMAVDESSTPKERGKPPLSIYRSAPIRLIDSDGPPARSGHVGSLDLACEPKDVLEATPAEPSQLDIRRPARATVINGPGELGSLWKDALRTAARCRGIEGQYDWNSITKEQADEVANYCFADVTARKGLQVLVNLFNPISLDKLEPLKRRTAITIGDHAAMILLRQQVLPMLQKQNDNLAKLNTDELIYGWGMCIKDACGSGTNPLGKLEVTKPPAADLNYGISKISFTLACLDNFLEKMYPNDSAGARRYFTSATKEILDQYREAAGAALARAKDADDCDVTELLEITGTGFDAVVAQVIPRLMKLEEEGDPPQLTWVPDRVARAYVNGLSRLAEAVKAQQDYAKLDTQFALLIAGGIASMPAIISEGFIAAVISFALNAGLFGVDASMALYDQYKGDEEFEFALGSRGVLGDDRLSEAILNKTEWWQTLAMLAVQAGLTGLDGVGAVLKHDLEAARKAAPAIMDKLKRASSLADGLKGLSPAEQKALLAAISDAEQAAVMKGLNKLTPEHRKLLDLGADLSVEAHAGGARLVPTDSPPSEPVRDTTPPSATGPPPARPETTNSGGGITDSIPTDTAGPGPRPTTPDTTSTPGPRPTTPDTTSTPGPRPTTPDTTSPPGPRPSTPDTTSTPGPRPTTPDTTSTPGPRPPAPDPTSSPGPRPSSPDSPPPPGPRPTTPDTTSTPGPRPTSPDTTSKPGPRPSTPDTTSTPGPRPTSPDTTSTPGPRPSAPESNTTPGPRHDGRTEAVPGPNRPRPPQPPEPRTPAEMGLTDDGMPSTLRDPGPDEPVKMTRREPTFNPSESRPTGDGPAAPREPTFEPSNPKPTGDGPPTRREPTFDPSNPKPTGDGPSTPREPTFDPTTPKPSADAPSPPKPGPAGGGAATPAPTPPPRTAIPVKVDATTPVVNGPPPTNGTMDPSVVYTQLPAKTRSGKDWKVGGFLYKDSAGRVYRLDECLGQGVFNRAYVLGGPGNEGLVIKFRMQDDVFSKAEMVQWAKKASDDLHAAKIEQVRVHTAVTDTAVPYQITDLADPKKGYKVFSFDEVGKEMALPPDQRKIWTQEHQEAVAKLSRDLAAEDFVAEDLKLDNIYFRKNDSNEMVAGVLDHDRIGRLDDAQMREWAGYYDPKRIDLEKPKVLKQIQDASKRLAKAKQSGASPDRIRFLQQDVDNLLKEYDALRSNFNMKSIRTIDPGDFDWSSAREWASRMFEHNHWVKYNEMTGKFEPQYLDPEVIKPYFDLDAGLGPNRPTSWRLPPREEDLRWRIGPAVPRRVAA